MKMEEKIERATAYMKDVALNEGRDWISPTEIGVMVGGIGNHSAFGSPICKKMVEQGLAKRNNKGHYCLISEHERVNVVDSLVDMGIELTGEYHADCNLLMDEIKRLREGLSDIIKVQPGAFNNTSDYTVIAKSPTQLIKHVEDLLKTS